MMKWLKTIATPVPVASTALVAFVVLLLGPGVSSTRGQELPELQLDAPILPEVQAAAPILGQDPLAAPSNSAVASDVVTSFAGCDSCGSIGCDGCTPGFACPPGLGLWIRADYMIWWEKDSDVIPLLTTSTGFPANPEELLTLAAPETSILFGNEQLEDNTLDGWRIEGGTWLDATATFGILGRYFSARGRDINFVASSDSHNFVGVPFFDVVDDAEDAFDVSIPDELRGVAEVNLTGDAEGFEILFRRNAHNGNNYRLDLLYGYRHFNLEESLRLRASNRVTSATGLNPQGTQISFNDQFDIDNQFNGFDFGVTGHSHEGMWSLDFLAKVALGSMNQEITVSGARVTEIPGLDPFRNIGGLFSQETNIGSRDETEFAFIPEVNVNLSYALTSNVDFTFGYTWIYVGDVVRAGTAVDRVVHSGLTADLDVDSDRPQVVFDETGYWLQGLNFGVTGRF